MATIIQNHRVSNYDSWKTGFDADSSNREQMGLNILAVGNRADDPEMVYIVAQTNDLEKVRNVMTSDGMQQRMREAGVTEMGEMIVLN